MNKEYNWSDVKVMLNGKEIGHVAPIEYVHDMGTDVILTPSLITNLSKKYIEYRNEAVKKHNEMIELSLKKALLINYVTILNNDEFLKIVKERVVRVIHHELDSEIYYLDYDAEKNKGTFLMSVKKNQKWVDENKKISHFTDYEISYNL